MRAFGLLNGLVAAAPSGWGMSAGQRRRRRRLIAVVFGLVLVGCGDDAAEPSSAPATQAPVSQAPVSQAPVSVPPADVPSPPQPAAPASPPEIVVQQGLGDATLGMSEAQVKQLLGEPLRTDTLANDTGPYTELTYEEFSIAFQRGGSFTGGASSFFVRGPGPRTGGGVGVGSTEEEVVAGVEGTTCEVLDGRRVCYVGAYTSGETITEFQIDGGQVTHVRVAAVEG